VPWLLVVQTARGARHAALIGWLHGIATWLVAIPWIAPTLVTYGQLPGWLSVVLLAVLAAYLGLFHGVFAVFAARMGAGGAWRALVGWPALWVGVEALRGVALGGFPWNPASHAWIALPGALPISAWIGGYGVSFLLVLANAGVALALRTRRWRPLAVGIALPVFALACGAAVELEAPTTPGRPVRILQPNIQNLVDPEPAAVWANYREVIAMAHEACDAPGALLVWPESAAWPFTFERDEQLRADVAALGDRGCPVLLNSPRVEGDRVFNSAYLAGGEGDDSLAAADKRHLVPFGEYVPFKQLIPFAGTLARNVGEFTAARELRLLSWGAERIGMAICFEVIFPSETAALGARGATILASVTNDAWYGDTSAPWQHLRAAQFRAAENRRPLLRAAITGVSALIDADGSLRSSLGPSERGFLAHAVAGRSERTLYSRAPWWPVIASLLLVLVAILGRR
jgi:apolipoprotein N-acyltransferase